MTIVNEGSESVTVSLRVTDPDGAVIANETERLDPSVGRTFNFTLSTRGRHRVRLRSDDWAAEFSWNTRQCLDRTTEITVAEGMTNFASSCGKTPPPGNR